MEHIALQNSIVRVAFFHRAMGQYDYEIPKQMEQSPFLIRGSFVAVSLRSQLQVGMVVSRRARNNEDAFKLKAIEAIFENSPISGPFIEWMEWIADYYHTPLDRVLAASQFGDLVPIIAKRYRLSPKYCDLQFDKCSHPAWHLISERLKKYGVRSEEQLKRGLSKNEFKKILAHFIKSNMVVEETVGVANSFAASLKGESLVTGQSEATQTALGAAPRLNSEQAHAAAEIKGAIESGEFKTFLLQGVTGSGKTEVYLGAIAEALKCGKKAILLVPEIALTPQMVSILQKRFGEAASVFHSSLTVKERRLELTKIASGQSKIAIGARSAVFLPLSNLGLIAVDEEHETTYKQESKFCYHARDIAIARALKEKATVVLGSATPQIETAFHAKKNKYALLALRKRIHERPMPEVTVVDLRSLDRAFGEKQILSPALLEAMAEALEKGLQTILFLNRRGYSSMVICTKCGQSEKCSQCAMSLTYHEFGGELKCHICGLTKKFEGYCYSCQSTTQILLGLGTQKVEEEVRLAFPEARLMRMDSDNVSTRKEYERFYTKMLKKEVDIVVGTQMIAKGLDFPAVSVVGIVLADLGLNIPDFRASERCFQLITQVAGRAGRDKVLGRVFVQTLNPGHYAITCAANQDYEEFYRQEIEIRKELLFPPFVRLGQFHFTGKENAEVEAIASKFHQGMKADVAKAGICELLGPSSCPIAYIRKQFRFQLLAKISHKTPFDDWMKRRFDSEVRLAQKSQVGLRFTMDPYHFL